MKNQSINSSRRGAALLTTLFIASAMAAIVASLLQMTSQSMQFSERSFLSNRSMALAEAGVEEGLSALRRESWTREDWTKLGDDMVKIIPGPSGDEIRIRVVNYDGTGTEAPQVLVQGLCGSPLGRAPVANRLRVDLGREPFFAGALIAMRKMKLKDHAFIDSYDSRLGPYGPDNMGYDAVVSVLDPNKSKDFTIDKTEIRGWVKSGGITPKISNNATIIGRKSVANGFGKGKWDPARVNTNFSQEFPVISAPTYYDAYADEMENPPSLGSPAIGPFAFKTEKFTIDEGFTTTIDGHVRLIVTKEMKIQGTLEITQNGSLEVWIEKKFKVDREGSIVVANNDPRRLIMFGSDRPWDKKVKSKFDFKGKDENFYGALYAPASRVKIEKGGDFFGSIVANNIEIKKAGSFHQDVSLRGFAGNVDDWLKDGGRDDAYLVSQWNTSVTPEETDLLAF